MNDIMIRAGNLSKFYQIGPPRHDSFSELMHHGLNGLFQRNGRVDSNRGIREFWALKDVSFEVNQGEVLGIIGRNGAGKSTLLKILSRITKPTVGHARIYGRIASLLEVGTGFQPELTGRENIYLNGAILGMKKAEIKRKFDEIVAFSELGKFIDTPVKRYSTGMYTRLAFAIAAHLECEILIVDEVLAVGDASFQKKCLGKMHEAATGGRTVLFVSHSMATVAQLCDRVLWLEKGEAKLNGDPAEVVAKYLSSTSPESRSIWISSTTGDAEFHFASARILSLGDQETTVVEYDSPFKVEIAYEVAKPIKDLSVICRLSDLQGTIIWTSWDSDNGDWKGAQIRKPGGYLSVCKIPRCLLKPGSYYISLGARSVDAKYDYFENVISFDVSEVGYRLNQGRVGVLAPILDWEIKETSTVFPL